MIFIIIISIDNVKKDWDLYLWNNRRLSIASTASIENHIKNYDIKL